MAAQFAHDPACPQLVALFPQGGGATHVQLVLLHEYPVTHPAQFGNTPQLAVLPPHVQEALLHTARLFCVKQLLQLPGDPHELAVPLQGGYDTHVFKLLEQNADELHDWHAGKLPHEKEVDLQAQLCPLQMAPLLCAVQF